jgi:hypothetical protein
MSITKEVLGKFFCKFVNEKLFWGNLTYYIELYAIDTIVKLIAIPFFYQYEVDYKVFLVVINLLSALISFVFNKFKVYILMFFIMLTTILSLYLTESFGHKFIYEMKYLEAYERNETLKIPKSYTERMSVVSSSTKGFVYNVSSNSFSSIKHEPSLVNWTLNTDSVNTVRYPYDDQSFFIFYPIYFGNRDKNFNRYSLTFGTKNVTLDLNRFSYKCNVDLEKLEVSCSTDKQVKKLKVLSFDDPFDFLASANKSLLTKTDFGGMGILRLNHLDFNYTGVVDTSKTVIIPSDELISVNSTVKMLFKNEVKLNTPTNRTYVEGSKQYRICRYVAVPVWYRSLDPNYIEWVTLILFLVLTKRNRPWKQVLNETANLGKYCFPLLVLNRLEPTLGKYLLCLVPEVLILFSGMRQFDRGFAMKFRSNLIKRSFVEGDCVTLTVMYCIQNNVEHIDVKRIGDRFHVRPSGPVKLNRFLSFYFSGFYLTKTNLDLKTRWSSFLTEKSFFEGNFYTSLMWSLFERQGYVKDFFVFEKIVASFHPRFSQFKINLRENSIKESPDTCKRVIYYVFKFTKAEIPNWGNYVPANVDVTFVKPQKNVVEYNSKTTVEIGKLGDLLTYTDPTGFPVMEIVKKNLVKTERKIISEKIVKRQCKVYKKEDFKRRPLEGGSILKYLKPVKGASVISMCKSCKENLEKDQFYRDLENKPNIKTLVGHQKKCELSKKKIVPMTGTLKPRVNREQRYLTSPLDTLFTKREFTQKTIVRGLKKLPKTKLDCKRRAVNKIDVLDFRVKTVQINPINWRNIQQKGRIKLSELIRLAKSDDCDKIHIAHLRGDINLKGFANEKLRIQSLKRFINNASSLENIIEFDIPCTSVTQL